MASDTHAFRRRLRCALFRSNPGRRALFRHGHPWERRERLDARERDTRLAPSGLGLREVHGDWVDPIVEETGGDETACHQQTDEPH